jgi:hypothetical protein
VRSAGRLGDRILRGSGAHTHVGLSETSKSEGAGARHIR